MIIHTIGPAACFFLSSLAFPSFSVIVIRFRFFLFLAFTVIHTHAVGTRKCNRRFINSLIWFFYFHSHERLRPVILCAMSTNEIDAFDTVKWILQFVFKTWGAFFFIPRASVAYVDYITNSIELQNGEHFAVNLFFCWWTKLQDSWRANEMKLATEFEQRVLQHEIESLKCNKTIFSFSFSSPAHTHCGSVNCERHKRGPEMERDNFPFFLLYSDWI